MLVLCYEQALCLSRNFHVSRLITGQGHGFACTRLSLSFLHLSAEFEEDLVSLEPQGIFRKL